ncbi:hypothetical protein GCM10029976_069060 [Kribbella albertanoniae]
MLKVTPAPTISDPRAVGVHVRPDRTTFLPKPVRGELAPVVWGSGEARPPESVADPPQTGWGRGFSDPLAAGSLTSEQPEAGPPVFRTLAGSWFGDRVGGFFGRCAAGGRGAALARVEQPGWR